MKYLPMNLQFFSEDQTPVSLPETTQPLAEVESTPDTNPEQQQEQPAKPLVVKTFTDNEVQKLIKEEIQKVSTIQYNKGIQAAAQRAGVDTKDPKKIDEWLSAIETENKAKLTAIQRAELERDEAKTELASAKAEVQRQSAKNLALSLDCNPIHADNVVVLALARVSDTLTIEEAVNAVMAEIPAFKRQPTKQEEPKTETPPPMYSPGYTSSHGSTRLEDIINRLKR